MYIYIYIYKSCSTSWRSNAPLRQARSGQSAAKAVTEPHFVQWTFFKPTSDPLSHCMCFCYQKGLKWTFRESVGAGCCFAMLCTYTCRSIVLSFKKYLKELPSHLAFWMRWRIFLTRQMVRRQIGKRRLAWLSQWMCACLLSFFWTLNCFG